MSTKNNLSLWLPVTPKSDVQEVLQHLDRTEPLDDVEPFLFTNTGQLRPEFILALVLIVAVAICMLIGAD